MKVLVRTDISQLSEHELQQAINALPEWRRELAMKFKFPLGKAECACSYLLLCQALREEYDITIHPHFEIGEHGKPSLREFPHIHFNMSHCRSGIAVAVSDKPVGIDIECLGRLINKNGDLNMSLAEYVLSPDELAQVTSAKPILSGQAASPAVPMDQSAASDLEFTKFWTQKEALVKLIGTGIEDDLKQILPLHPEVSISTSVSLADRYALSIASFRKAFANDYDNYSR